MSEFVPVPPPAHAAARGRAAARGHAAWIAALTVASLAVGVRARAQTPIAATSRAEPRGASSAASSAPDIRDSASPRSDTARRHLPRWLAVNGYLTQAGAVSQGGTVSGVPSRGTVDYRRLALLARAEPTLSDRFVVQIANRRVGASPAAQYQPDVRLDWLFYEHAFGDATRVRVGRVPLPFGIYNETRYVGTLLPFYQAPTSVYREKEFSSESSDGALIAHEFGLPAGFGAELSAYAGGLNYVETSSLPWIPPLPNGEARPGTPPGQPAAPTPNGWTYTSARAKARGARGVQLWVTTPVPGLRAGFGALRTRLSGGLFRPNGQVDHGHVVTAAIDGSFERITVRAEAFDAGLGVARLSGGYVQFGTRVAGPLSIYAQIDQSYMRIADVPIPPTYSIRTLDFVQNRDHAVSAVVALRRGLQLRAEGHRTLGYNAEEAIPLDGPARRGRFGIVSLSAAF